jgi:siroheme synthase (precorrin-2 oxidase/ferrochelatase)
MFEVEGGTQALSRTMTYRVEIGTGDVVSLSVPDELGALVLKGAAYSVDRRERDRHLMDAAVLAACIPDHAAELERLGGSDRRRLRTLANALADPTHPAWLALGPQLRIAGQDTLRILTD